MFKSVEYTGFDGLPGHLRLAERGTQILASEIGGTWHDKVEVVWEAHPVGAKLTVTLTLPTGIGTGSRFIPESDFADEDLLRSRCRSAWSRALDDLLDKRKAAWDEMIRQPAEV
jgi:hypothetical protein